jgi:hypothetical protein
MAVRSWWRWGGVLIVLVGVLLLWQSHRPLYAAMFFGEGWGDPASVREWLGSTSYQIGLVQFVLVLVAAGTAWPHREEAVAKRVLALVAAAIAALLLTLAGGPILLLLAVAGMALVLAAGGLGRLDPFYRSLPVRLAIIALAALLLYPNLQSAWLEPLEHPPAVGTFWGEPPQLVLLDVEVNQSGSEATVEALWQVTDELTTDYTAFVHLLDAEGQSIGQADALLRDDEGIHSSGWPTGYLVRQRYTTTLGEEPHAVRLGLYDLATLERLPLRGGGDSVLLPVPDE